MQSSLDISEKFLYYDTAKEMFVLAPTQEVLTKEGHGLAMRKTQCPAGADPEIFSWTFNCGNAQIWKITNFFHFQ